MPYPGGCSQFLSPPKVLIRPSAIGKIKFPLSLRNITSFALSLFDLLSNAPIVSNSSKSASILWRIAWGLTFHRICPPIFIQTWLQQHSRGASFYSAHCSFSNSICFRSGWCRRAMIRGEIFTSLPNQRIVSVNDFWFPLGFQELLQAPFPQKFCLARIRLNPLGGQVLHHDCISVIFRDSQLSLRTLWSAVIKSPIFSARSTASPLRLLHDALVILVLWQISQFRSFGK